jgi:hypothetical protein
VTGDRRNGFLSVVFSVSDAIMYSYLLAACKSIGVVQLSRCPQLFKPFCYACSSQPWTPPTTLSQESPPTIEAFYAMIPASALRTTYLISFPSFPSFPSSDRSLIEPYIVPAST